MVILILEHRKVQGSHCPLDQVAYHHQPRRFVCLRLRYHNMMLVLRMTKRPGSLRVTLFI